MSRDYHTIDTFQSFQTLIVSIFNFLTRYEKNTKCNVPYMIVNQYHIKIKTKIKIKKKRRRGQLKRKRVFQKTCENIILMYVISSCNTIRPVQYHELSFAHMDL